MYMVYVCILEYIIESQGVVYTLHLSFSVGDIHMWTFIAKSSLYIPCSNEMEIDYIYFW